MSRPPKAKPNAGAAPATRGPVKPAEVPPGLVCLGAFAGSRGVSGEVRIKPFTDDPLSVGDYGPVRDLAERCFTLTQVRLQGDFVLARVEGVASREAADALKGTAFFVERTKLPDPDDEDDFYQADLIGLEAVLADGTPVGRVTAVQDFGAGDLLEVRLAGARRSVLVPFTKEVVPRVEIAARRLIVDPPPGLLDEPEAEPTETAEAQGIGPQAEPQPELKTGPGETDQ